MLAFCIRQHRDEHFLTIENMHLEKISSLNFSKVDWIKATRYFYYHLITQWVTCPDLSHDQQFQVLNLIKEKYLIAKQRNPDLLFYDLNGCFSQLHQLLMGDHNSPEINNPTDISIPAKIPNPPKNQLLMVRMIEDLNASLDELKDQNAQLTQIIMQQNEEIMLLHEKHDEEIRNMKIVLNDHEENYKRKEFTVTQIILVFH